MTLFVIDALTRLTRTNAFAVGTFVELGLIFAPFTLDAKCHFLPPYVNAIKINNGIAINSSNKINNLAFVLSVLLIVLSLYKSV